ncbi:MAG TPA: SIR2 family protein [Solirubrobacterales bacterium]|nr:SIR2 family protein [Solirubrobacterales bacterium]
MSEKRPNPSSEDRLAQLLRPSRRVVPVSGAGVAQSAGLPGSAELARRLLEGTGARADYGGDPANLRSVVDFLTPRHCGEAELVALAATEIASVEPRTSPLIEALIRVPSRFVLTLNFDHSLERAAEAAGMAVLTLGNSAADLGRAVSILVEEEPPAQLTVLHLHGSIAEPASMVLAPAGYRHIPADPLGQVFYELAVRRTMVFFGTKLDETYLLSALAQVEARDFHVLWCLRSEEAELTTKRAAILPGNSGIHVVAVDYPEEFATKARLLLDVDLPAAEPAHARHLDEETSPYVENRLIDRRDPTDPGDRVRLSLGLDPEREVRPEPTEADLLDLPRAIVLGDPGSGKTELLRRLTRRSPRSGVFIRLAHLELEPSHGPLETLAAWARQGATAVEGLDVGIGALAQERFHFFLDGLDEVVSEQQGALAEKINLLAEALPRHAFTISTRPLPSLELLRLDAPEAIGWSQFALAPDTGWRDRFLASRSASLEALYEEMPALEDLEEVLTTPFYLCNVVDLHERGELRGIGDFGQLLFALVGSAIEREQETLALTGEVVRAWLRRLALAAAIAGRRTFSVDDLHAFGVPEGGGDDVVELARTLEQRLLLAEEGGSFRFHHRLLGEQLAAEAMVEAGPSPALLDCLVPYLDRDLSGVRPDLVVPLSLACLASSAWRAALQRRDPLAAARATPDDAPESEREAALRVLWENALATQVWVWERGIRIADDAEAMARLVKGGPAGETAAAIHAAIDSGTDQDQGNAVRVLSRAGGARLEELLDRVLAEKERDEVVLRQAMMAAADLGSEALAERIVELLLAREEHSIHQVGAIALDRLFGDQPRIDLYLRLMAGPEADYMLANALDRVEPVDGVILLAEFLRQGNTPRDFWSRERVPTLLDGVDFAAAGTEVIEATVDVAVSFERGASLRALREVDPEALLRRLVVLQENEEERDIDWWQLAEVAALFEPEELEEASLSEEVVRHVRQRREAERERAEAEAAGQPWPPPRPGREEEDEEPEQEPPTLAELLDRPDSDPQILNHARYFTSQVSDLDERHLAELRRRLESWWPERPYRETITRLEANSWRQEAGAHAWVALGPRAQPPLDQARWAELATCGILFEEHQTWLAATQSPEAVYGALELIAGDVDPDRWQQFLSCCHDPLPGRVLESCACDLGAKVPAEERIDLQRVRTIAARMVENGRHDLVEQLAAGSPAREAELFPILAEAGDSECQRCLLDQLIEQLDEGVVPQQPVLSWLSPSPSPLVLGRLFEVLRRTWGSAERPVGRVTSGYGLFDITSPTLEGIALIGGREAVAGYDDLIAEGGAFRWLRRSREDVGGALLIVEGERFAEGAAASLGLPWMGGSGA